LLKISLMNGISSSNNSMNGVIILGTDDSGRLNRHQPISLPINNIWFSDFNTDWIDLHIHTSVSSISHCRAFPDNELSTATQGWSILQYTTISMFTMKCITMILAEWIKWKWCHWTVHQGEWANATSLVKKFRGNGAVRSYIFSSGG
jgi:hypothetical protein